MPSRAYDRYSLGMGLPMRLLPKHIGGLHGDSAEILCSEPLAASSWSAPCIRVIDSTPNPSTIMDQATALLLKPLLQLSDPATESARDLVRRVVPASEIGFNDGRMSVSPKGIGVLCRAVLTGKIGGDPCVR